MKFKVGDKIVRDWCGKPMKAKVISLDKKEYKLLFGDDSSGYHSYISIEEEFELDKTILKNNKLNRELYPEAKIIGDKLELQN